MDGNPPALVYLNQIQQRIGAIRGDVGKLVGIGEKMARHLIAGGEIFCPPICKWWVSEFSGRSGGLMGIQWGSYAGGYQSKSAEDVAYVALPREWTDESRAAWKKLIDSPARIFAIGEAAAVREVERVEAFTGLGDSSEDNRSFEQLVRGWLVAGEMIAACTRAGRMPHIWMSVWLEGAMVRNASFVKHNNMREPWKAPLFHESIYIPPLPARYASEAFLAELERIRSVLAQQSQQIQQAGRWLAEAARAQRHISMMAVGHCYPEILELPDEKAPMRWCRPLSDLSTAVPAKLGDGDVAIHLGYSPVDVAHVRAILDRGVRFIYSSPYGRPAALQDHPNLLWLDLPWRPADATVDVPGYSVRILPMSSSVHTIAYFALLAEMQANL